MPSADAAGDPGGALVARDLACERGGRILFSGLSFSVPAGGALVVTGPNGAGKSSLLRVLAGLLPPDAGSVRHPPPTGFDTVVGYLGHANAIKDRLSVRENLEFWAQPGGYEANVDPTLKALGMTGIADMPAGWLSAGQQRRLAWGRLSMTIDRVWLLDEPAINLDAAGESRLLEEIGSHRAVGGIAVVATPTDVDFADAERLALGG